MSERYTYKPSAKDAIDTFIIFDNDTQKRVGDRNYSEANAKIEVKKLNDKEKKK